MIKNIISFIFWFVTIYSFCLALVVSTLWLADGLCDLRTLFDRPNTLEVWTGSEVQDVNFTVVEAEVTAFNTVPEQTDSKPCESASGDWICGRDNVVACPPGIPFKTWVEIQGKRYECLDLTAPAHSQRFDISFDKDLAGAAKWGIKTVQVKIFNP